MLSASMLALIVAFAFAAGVQPLQAQTSSGSVIGVVTDPTAAVVPGATVTLTDKATGTARTTVSNDQGRYVFVNTNAGSYDISVAKQGFSTARIANQTVSVGQQLTANVQLQVGQANEEVVVESSAGAQLQTLNATVGTTVDSRRLQELPNLSRDVSSLLTLQPAISTNGSVAGAVRDQNTFQLDGGQNSSDMDGTMNTYTGSYASSGGVTGVMPTPVESIEEFKVNVSNQTADFNGSAGAQVQMVTKRGGNQWHGGVYEYYLGSNFGANTWQNKHTPTKDGTGKVIKPLTNLPSNHYNRFGASAGGPIGPKFFGGPTYIFGNYEGRRYPQNTTVDKTVPSPLMRLGVIQVQDAAGKYQPYNLNPYSVTYNGVTYAPAVCAAGPCDPRTIGINADVAAIWNKYMPLPNDATAGDTYNTQGYLTALKLPQNDNFGVLRVDHDFGAKWHFMSSYRYYHLQRAVSNQYDVGGFLAGSFGQAVSTAQRPQVPSFLVAGMTTNITANVTNDFHYNYLRNYWEWKTAGAPPQLPGLGGALEIGGEACSNTGSSSSALIPYCVRTQDARQRYWNGHDHTIRDDVSWLKGNHLIQFGGTYERNWDAHRRNDNGLGIMAANVYQIGASSNTSSAVSGLNIGNYVPAAVTAAGSTQINAYRNLYAQVLGIVTQPQSLYSRSTPDLALQPFGTPVVAHSITPSYNLYVSDTWHMKPTFTLTYGLGYQVEMPPYEVDGKQVMAVDASGNPVYTEKYLAARKDAASQGQVYNPIIGFAAIPNVAGKRKYPYDPFYLGFSPRLSAAWNPHFEGGLLGKVFGQNQTVLRGGWGRLYGRLNGVTNILTPLLAPSLLQAVQCQGATMTGQCLGTGGADPNTAFRIGTDGNTAPLPSAAPTLAQPFLPGVAGAAASGDALALDPSFRPNRVDSFNFTIQREITSRATIEVGYIGRLIRNELVDLDLNAVPYMTVAGGQRFDAAYANVFQTICGLQTNCAANLSTYAYTGAPQAFFESALGGTSSAFCAGFSSCTAALFSAKTGAGVANKNSQLSKLALGSVYDMWTAMAASSAWTLGRTLPAANPPGGCPKVPTSSTVCQEFTSLAESLSNGYGNYHALFTTFTLRDWHGMTGSSNFTWGKALGTGATTQSSSGYTVTDPWDLHSMYGPQFFDTKFLYNSSLSYHLPFFRSQSGVVGKVLGGWGIAPLFSAQSGLPLQVSDNGNCQSFGESSCSNTTNENAVLMGSFPGLSQHYNVSSSGKAGASGNPASSGGKGVGVNAFADPQGVYNSFRRLVLGVDHGSGAGGRVYGFAKWNLDMSITKETQFTERFGATFYATFTNVLNHMQPSDPTLNFDSPGSWGVVTQQDANYPSRQLELGLRIHF
ncbi:MAG TPA: carboxypeptidase-like regulatory domain-containing protein [Terriglobales bacterium]|nr:carboxypeptidase-like regulatory domain-containing protein [Terriglobales bacterium]